LPIFAEKSQPLAKEFHNGSSPDRLKDLCDRFRYEQGGLIKGDFFLSVADSMDIEAVTAESKSFAQFRNQVTIWV
jgi:hypothetical protein